MTIPLESSFASDNWSGLCPEALDAFILANQGSCPPYGSDGWSEKARQQIQSLLDCDAEVFFVASGTAGNSLALAHLTQPYHSILCHGLSHILLDECGAPGFFGQGLGLKAISHSDDALIQPEDLVMALKQPQDLRFQPPAVLSLTQSTERGTLYPVKALSKLTTIAREHGLRIHMDGARFLQATEALNVPPAELSWRAGIDVLTLGSSKIGGGLADAVVVFNRELAKGFEYRLKQAGQVPAKYRLLTAPWVGLLESNTWLHHARNANAIAADLEARLLTCGITPSCPRQSNMLFVPFSAFEIKELRNRGWQFHAHPETGVTRLVTGWEASSERNRQFTASLIEIQNLNSSK